MRLGRRLEDNIIMNLRKIWYVDVDWTHVAEDRGQWRASVNLRVS
jgi:hypothetical protein